MKKLFLFFLTFIPILIYSQQDDVVVNTDSIPKVGIHVSYFGGVWIPNGNLSILGNHPLVGVQFGIRTDKLLIDLTLQFKFLKSQNHFQVNHNNTSFDTDHFFGGYYGLDLGYNLINRKSNLIDLLSGVGLDGFDVLKINDKVKKTINTLNLNIGIGYRRIIGSYTYIGLDIKYNFIDYDNSDGTNLSGDAMSSLLKFGLGF